MCHQPVKGRAGAALQLRHELGFVPGPGEDARQVRHVLPPLSPTCAERSRDAIAVKRLVPCAAGFEATHLVVPVDEPNRPSTELGQ